ncbi:Serine/threonine-protein kinase SRPK, partial [Leucoagaricus sp. SymC.cos]
EELKAIDSKVLATAMGSDELPEEPLLSTFEEGFGCFTAAAVNSSLNQYQFVHKLGLAVSSSAWLALDNSVETRTFVVMKLLTAHATAQIALGHSPEYDVFRKVDEAGGHICFVTEALSSNLQKLPVTKRITKQVLLALDYFHFECGYIHTDLKADNILASTLPPANSNDPTVHGPPLHLKSSDVPLVLSRSQPLPYFELGGTLENISVCLVDYLFQLLTEHHLFGQEHEYSHEPHLQHIEIETRKYTTVVINLEILMQDSRVERLWKNRKFVSRITYFVFDEGHYVTQWEGFREAYCNIGTLQYIVHPLLSSMQWHVSQ